MSTGGIVNGRATNDTWLYHLELNQWYSGPSLKRPRSSHSCALLPYISNTLNSITSVIIIAGGQIADKSTDQNANSSNASHVELLFFDDQTFAEWRIGTDLPIEDFDDSVMVTLGHSVILVTGNKLFQLFDPLGKWKQMPQKLNSFRKFPVAFLIPENLTNCQGKSIAQMQVKVVGRCYEQFNGLSTNQNYVDTILHSQKHI